MRTEIYYFSGTGNSLVVARDIAEKTNGKLIPIASMMDTESIRTDADVIGIVFPVYNVVNDGMPLIIKKFVRKLENIGSKYIFAVCTCGGGSGSTIENIGKVIKTRGGKLAAGFTVKMPSNVSHVTKEKQQKMFDDYTQKIDIICEYVNTQKEGKFETIGALVKFIFAPLVPIARHLILGRMEKLSETSQLPIDEFMPLIDKSFHSDEKCDGCGICSRVCPTSNIEMADHKPSWQHHCENCLACLNWCPKEAIHSGLTSNERKYHHPDVKISDMLGH